MIGMENAALKNQGRQVPIVCPGHTRPLAELQFIHVPAENKTLLISACHGTKSNTSFNSTSVRIMLLYS